MTPAWTKLAAVVSITALAIGCSSASGEEEQDGAFEDTEGAASDERQCGTDPFAETAVRGIDVSRHQGKVDFQKVAAATEMRLTPQMFNVGPRRRAPRSIPGKVVFAAARVSDGLSVKEGQNFIDNIRNIRAAGLIPGAYQFLRPNQDAKAQAEYFIQELDKAGGYQPGDLPPTVDIEVSDGTTPKQVQDGVAIWLEIVGKHYKVKPVVYSLAGISSYLGSRFTGSPLWIANFYQQCPKMPSAWRASEPQIPWTFFQFDDAGVVDGIPAGNYVDLNVFNGTRADFDLFLLNSQVANP